MSNKTHDEFRQYLRDTRWFAHAGEENAKELAYLTLGLGGEAGEFTDEVKKVVREVGFDLSAEGLHEFIRDDGHQAKLIEELGDVLWYMMQLCDFLGISLDILMLTNTYKLHQRYKERNIGDLAKIPWPFSNPFDSEDNVRITWPPPGDDNVCVDETV